MLAFSHHALATYWALFGRILADRAPMRCWLFGRSINVWRWFPAVTLVESLMFESVIPVDR